MKTQGEVEAAICEGITRFGQDYMGRGPKDIHAHLVGDLLVVRLQGILTAAEQQLVKTLPVEKGRDFAQRGTGPSLSRRPEASIAGGATVPKRVTGTTVLSLHHDISTTTGEEVVVFTLTESRRCSARETKEKNRLLPELNELEITAAWRRC